jgi:hypothetical protein
MLLAVVYLGIAPVGAQGPGSMVFSKTPLDLTNPQNLSTAFSAGDRIYAAGYFSRPLERGSQTKKVPVTLKIFTVQPALYDYQQPSEKFEDYYEMGLSGSLMEARSLLVDLAPEPTQMKAYRTAGLHFKKFGEKVDGPAATCDVFSRLGPGKHTLIFRLEQQDSPLASGQITLEGSDFSAYSSLAQQLRRLYEQASAHSATMPAARMRDAGLESSLVAALKKSETYRTRIQGKVLRLVITDPEWFIERHPISGLVLFRYLRAAAAVQDADGACWVYPLITFKQDFVGNSFQPVRFDGAGDRYRIEPAQVGK